MYITITPQKIGAPYGQSAADFVAYLEKENAGKALADKEYFFNQYADRIPADTVIAEIDQNTAKLKKKEPKFYSITFNPSMRELKAIQSSPQALKHFVRAAMKEYAGAFHREIDGRAVQVEDLKYYAKLEYERRYKGTDQQVRENQPYLTRILALKKELYTQEQIESNGNFQEIKKEIVRLEKEAPHQLNGKPITRGCPKPGPQHHIHVIVSRKDASNRYSLSPGSKYKASEVTLNGKQVKRGFHRDAFYTRAEKCFDRLFNYKRNYVEAYPSRKTFLKDPSLYFSALAKLPTTERAVAFKLLRQAEVPMLSLPSSELAVKALQKLKKGVGKAIDSGTINL